ncbi:MAG TPA: hypothetical protein VFI37_14125 [Gaiellaceae bacterium]|nr:hypothetical protein [Gaiellaceae bacterium]
MTSSSPRISPRLAALVELLAERGERPAEIRRRVGDEADRLGLPHPSYETVRRIAREWRTRPRYPTAAEVLADVAFRVRPPDAIVDQLAGTLPPKRPK